MACREAMPEKCTVQGATFALYSLDTTDEGNISPVHHKRSQTAERSKMEALTYTVCGDYLIPNIRLSDAPAAPPLGRYGRKRRAFLKEHRPIFYASLLLSEKLFPHLREIDEAAAHRLAVPRLRRRRAANRQHTNPPRRSGTTATTAWKTPRKPQTRPTGQTGAGRRTRREQGTNLPRSRFGNGALILCKQRVRPCRGHFRLSAKIKNGGNQYRL